VVAQGVGDLDRGFGIGHPDVDVQRRGRRAEQARQVLLDDVVARLGDQVRLALVVRMEPGTDYLDAAAADGPSQPRQLLERLGRVVADPGLQLDLAGEDLGRDAPADLGAERPHHPLGGRNQTALTVDQQQLFLDPDRERRRGAEAVLGLRAAAGLGGRRALGLSGRWYRHRRRPL
jgi:hypothetical protein